MRKNLKQLLVSAIAILTLSFGAVGCASNSIEAKAQIIEVTDVVESKIVLNDEVDIPSSITVNYNGTKEAKNGVVVYPDGKIVNAGKVRLNQMGVYELRYYFEDGGVTHTAVQKVEVYSDYFNLSNPEGGEIIVSDDDNSLYCKKDGVIVNLKSGTSFVYNKVLDLRDCDEDGLSPIIELDTRYGHVDEDGKYVSDVLEGWVRLTDCYNPNLYIELRMQRSVNYMGCLFPGVKTNTQPVTGLDKGATEIKVNTNRIINLDGSDYRAWIGDGSMSIGMYNINTALSTGAVWKYDMQTKRVYLTYNDRENTLVTDLDESLIYDDNCFPGFTTGEVFVTIYANGYESTYAQTEIVSIGRDNMKDVVGTKYVDTVAPEIIIDQAKTNATGIYGAVGDVVTVPSATAIDVNIVDGVDVAVYRGYGTKVQTNVSVVNGKFTLAHKDVYTIVYTAKDKAGNVAKETFTVTTVDTQDNRAVTLQPLVPATMKAGEKVTDLFNVTNSINVDANNVDVEIFIESENQNLAGKGKNFSFIPYYAGEYTIRYVYTDGVFNYEKTVNVQCESSDSVCFLDEVISPQYYIKGDYYAIDDITAYTFTNGYPEAVATEIYACFDGGAEQKLDSASKVLMSGNANVYFVYRAANGVTMTTDCVSLLESEYVNASGKVLGYDMTKFFVGDFTSSALKADGKRTKDITFTSNVTSGNNQLTYFNQIGGRNFAVEYKIIDKADKFGSLKINLTDVTDSENKLTAEIFNKEDGTYISVNNGRLTKLDSVEFVKTIHNITYDCESKFFRMGEYSTIVDFNASAVYFDVEMVDITGTASIVISKLNNTTIAGNVYADTTNPEIYVRDFQGDYQVGDVINVSIPEYTDVISGLDYSTAKLTIACSDAKAVYDSKGNVLTDLQPGGTYDLKLDRIAKYYVVYEIADFSENVAQKTIAINCADTTAPEIKLHNVKEGQILQVKAHQEIELHFTVSDNVTLAKNIITWIHLYCVDMYSFVPNVTNIEQANAPANGIYKEKFSIHIKGKYEAQINAYDAEGNHCLKVITIIVE